MGGGHPSPPDAVYRSKRPYSASCGRKTSVCGVRITGTNAYNTRTMNPGTRQLLEQIARAKPANEAEVETKVLLHVFRLLGFSDNDRDDKPAVVMQFGRSRRTTHPDFILYDGQERSLSNALITVEAKAPGVPLGNAEAQARSYASWAGTPFLLVCNGEQLAVAHFVPGAMHATVLELAVIDIAKRWQDIHALIGKHSAIIAKERLEYLSVYLPKIEALPAAEFFHEYLSRLRARYLPFQFESKQIQPLAYESGPIPKIPVTVQLHSAADSLECTDKELALSLQECGTRICVTGVPGCGKSTLCRRIVLRITDAALANTIDAIPIYVRLREGIPATARAAFQQACNDLGVRVFPNLFDSRFASSKIILILDGLDELPLATTLTAKIHSLLDQHTDCSLLVTTRPPAPRVISDLVTEHGFAEGTIRALTDEELAQVFDAYLARESQRQSLEQLARQGQLPDLRSPMLALMAIRVANDNEAFASGSTFDLYREYVSVLHSFFNHPSIRDDEASVSDEQLLDALSEASLIYQEARHEGLQLTLEQCEISLCCRTDPVIARALINTGILTSIAGHATFIHLSFYEFGSAWGMMQSVRQSRADQFARWQPTNNSYRIAHSAMSDVDQMQLSEWCGHDDKHVRKRATGILQYGCNQDARDRIWYQLIREPSDKIWGRMLSLLVWYDDDRVVELVNNEGQRLSKRRRRKLAWAIRRSTTQSGLFTAVLRLIAICPNATIATAAFSLILNSEDRDYLDRAVALYEERRGRASMCGKLVRQNTDFARTLAVRLLHLENSPRLLCQLLKASGDQIVGLSQSDQARISEQLMNATDLKSVHRKRLRKVLRCLDELQKAGLEGIYRACVEAARPDEEEE